MILDVLKNCELYAACDAFKSSFDFLKTLSADSKEKRYELDNGIYAVIESYQSKNKSDGRLEAHKDFLDIQMVLSGSELIGWQNIEGLTIETDYDTKKDIMFFSNKNTHPSFIEMTPSIFMILFPDDGHMPQIRTTDNSEQVKKVVVKIPLNYIPQCSHIQ